MVVDHRSTYLTHFRSKIAFPLSYIQYTADLPFRGITNLKNFLQSHNSLVAENLKLKTEHLILKVENQRLAAMEFENQQIRAVVHAAEAVQSKSIISRILAIDNDPFINQIILDKGANHNVYVGQPVLDSGGLLGKVIEVNAVSSRVLLINDSHSGVPVLNTRNGIRGVVVGDSYSNLLHLVNVPQTVDVKVGDRLTTSGLGSDYPSGYLVGRVTIVNKVPGMQFSDIDVMPSSHSDKSKYVLLIWPNLKAQA